MNKNNLVTRRTAIRGGAAIAAAATLGGLAVVTTEPAKASHAINNLDFDANVAVSNDVGDLSFVEVGVAVDMSWDGFEVPVHYLNFIETVSVERDGAFVLGGEGNFEGHEFYRSGITSLSDHDGSSSLNSASSPGTSGSIHAEVQLGGSPFVLFADSGEGKDDPWHDPGPYTKNDLDILEPGSDGETLKSRVTFTKVIRLFDENQDAVTGPGSGYEWAPPDPVAEGDFVVEVTNEPASSSTSGTGSTDGG